MNTNSPIQNKYDIFFLMDVKNGNPNGDPDGNNAPRQHRFGNCHGFITDVCLKRKIRDWVTGAVEAGALPADDHDMYISAGRSLDAKDREMAEDAKLCDPKDPIQWKELAKDASKDKVMHDMMCARYFDVRTFGAVVTSMANSSLTAAIRGPAQVIAAESFHDIAPERLSIHRLVTTKEDKEDKKTTFGDKWIVPYALYGGSIHINTLDAAKTGFSEDDLNTLLKALETLFDNDRSAARGEMATRKIVVFKHSSKWGNAPYAKLRSLVHVDLKDGVDVPKQYEDYEITIDTAAVPEGVSVTII